VISWTDVCAFARWLLWPERRVQEPPAPSSEAPGDPAAYELAYREAVRAIEGQRVTVDELRGRTGTLLSAALLVGALLGGPASQTTGQGYVVGACAFLLVALALSLVVLRPMAGWRFRVGTQRLLRDYVENAKAASIAELHRSLAWYIDADYTDNEKKLRWLYRGFAMASLCVAAETMLWLAAILQPRAQ
jgi:hypothetical protein